MNTINRIAMEEKLAFDSLKLWDKMEQSIEDATFSAMNAQAKIQEAVHILETYIKTNDEFFVRGYRSTLPKIEKDLSDVVKTLKAIAIKEMSFTSSQKLNQSVKSKITNALSKAGLDGNKSFERLGIGLSVISEVLSKFGIEHDIFTGIDGKEGRKNIDLSFSNPEDAFSPEEISNAMLVLTWHQHESGRYEMVAYIS